MTNGNIYVVGIGPGNMEDISVRAYNILKNVNVIAGYTTYVDLVKDKFSDKEFLVSGMKREIERCREVLEVAKAGKNVALISSGDAGIYGMAGIMLEVAMGSGIEVEVVPGITSRVECASQGDFVISLYNPKSKGRTEQIVEAKEIMLKYKLATTPVALLRHIGRKEENYTLTTLKDFLNFEIDMFTIVLVGNSNTYVKNGKMITPRGYEKKSN